MLTAWFALGFSIVANDPYFDRFGPSTVGRNLFVALSISLLTYTVSSFWDLSGFRRLLFCVLIPSAFTVIWFAIADATFEDTPHHSVEVHYLALLTLPGSEC